MMAVKPKHAGVN